MARWVRPPERSRLYERRMLSQCRGLHGTSIHSAFAGPEMFYRPTRTLRELYGELALTARGAR
jgi:hypothetical protein